MITFSIIGLGNRGSVYADGLMKQKDVKITAVCDICPESLKKAKDVYCVPEGNLFLSDDTFFEKKRADILIVSTMDEYHKDHAIRGMELGYDILLEKPVAPTMEECLAILEAGKKRTKARATITALKMKGISAAAKNIRSKTSQAGYSYTKNKNYLIFLPAD